MQYFTDSIFQQLQRVYGVSDKDITIYLFRFIHRFQHVIVKDIKHFVPCNLTLFIVIIICSCRNESGTGLRILAGFMEELAVRGGITAGEIY